MKWLISGVSTRDGIVASRVWAQVQFYLHVHEVSADHVIWGVALFITSAATTQLGVFASREN
jgi:hypothetical protein